MYISKAYLKLLLIILGSFIMVYPQPLSHKIKRISQSTDGLVGVAAVHEKSGFVFHFNGNKRFPLASTVKVPLALLFLKKVDLGFFDLDERISIKETDVRSGDSLLAKRYAPSMSLTYKDLVRLMIEMSDNTATDILFKAVGGPQAVSAFVQSCGINDFSCNRTALHILGDFCGIEGLPSDGMCTLSFYYEQHDKVDLKKRKAVLTKFYKDIRDTATPVAMIELLKLVDIKTCLKDETRVVLIDAMRLCQTGLARIPALLPGLAVAQKTGSLYSWPGDAAITNDSAIITLPDGSKLFLTVFIKQSTKPRAVREGIIARIARVIVDHVLKAESSKEEIN